MERTMPMTKEDRHRLEIQQDIAGAYTQTDSMGKHIDKQLDFLHTSGSTILLKANQLYPIPTKNMHL